jgi:hypothetical protein
MHQSERANDFEKPANINCLKPKRPIGWNDFEKGFRGDEVSDATDHEPEEHYD